MSKRLLLTLSLLGGCGMEIQLPPHLFGGSTPKDPSPIDLAALDVHAPGWEAEYDPTRERWTFEKGVEARFYIDYIDPARPADVEEYATQLEYTSIERKDWLENGWLITGVMNGEPAFVLYRTDKGIYCHSGAFFDATIRDEAVETCKKL